MTRQHYSTAVRGPMRRRFAEWLAFWTVAALAATGAVAQEASKTLTDIQVQRLPNQQVELRLILTGPAEDPLSFTIDNPGPDCARSRRYGAGYFRSGAAT